MSSQRRKDSSRANGAKSRGPITPEGKKRSSQNAADNGKFAECIILLGEPPEGIGELRDYYDRRFQPSGHAEQCCVDQMVAADWRLARILTIETQVLNKQLHLQPAGPNPFFLADALEAAAKSPVLELLQRTETRLQLMFQRAIRTFKLLRTIPVPSQDEGPNESANNEPNPIPEHPKRVEPNPPPPPQPTDSEDFGTACFSLPTSSAALPTRNQAPAKPPAAAPAWPPRPKETGAAA